MWQNTKKINLRYSLIKTIIICFEKGQGAISKYYLNKRASGKTKALCLNIFQARMVYNCQGLVFLKIRISYENFVTKILKRKKYYFCLVN